MENRITIQKLEETAEWLAELRVKLAEKLRKAPEGALHSKNCRGTQQFYVKKDGIRKYLRKSDWNLAKQIAQRDYYKKLLSQVCSDLTYLDTFLRKFDVDKLYDIYDELPIARQKLVEPFLIRDKQYIAEWEQIIYDRKDFEEGSQEIYTERGERVRSKSEKIIADKLFLQNIPPPTHWCPSPAPCRCRLSARYTATRSPAPCASATCAAAWNRWWSTSTCTTKRCCTRRCTTLA